jgi:hypothetical protein
MLAHPDAGIAARGSLGFLVLAFAACAVDVARADVPMLTRHASFDGDHAARDGKSGVGPVVGSSAPGGRFTGDGDGGAATAQAFPAGIDHHAPDAMFTDGFQPPARLMFAFVDRAQRGAR